MSALSKFLNLIKPTKKIESYQLVSGYQNFTLWGNSAFDNDIVRGCVMARAKRMAKLQMKHIVETTDADGNKITKVNPEPYMRFLLEEPNPYMTINDFLMKLSIYLDLNGNFFAVIVRDENGFPRELYPVPTFNATVEYTDTGTMYYKFRLHNGKSYCINAADVIHIRQDYYDNDVFGRGKIKALSPLIEVVETTDRGLINAIKNSGVIKWLLKYKSALRDEDLTKHANKFAENYLNITSSSIGVAAVDSKADAQQITATDYVPNAALSDRTAQRILKLFNMSEKILRSEANENEENEYYEACIEPIAIALKNEFTRKLFSRRQRGCGNYISIATFDLQTASITTKLSLVQMVDRGAMTVNEWRNILGLSPVEGGDEPIRRLDTAPVSHNIDENEVENNESNRN
ncbi:MAG: phage portal protein [Ruminococcus sp.]